MRILHVALGLSPLRTGGLTRYCEDLIAEQINQGHTVALLYPGRPQKVTKVIEGCEKGIITFEVTGSTPVPLVYGVGEPTEALRDCDDSAYQCVYDFNPSVVHVHSIMGIHKAFFGGLVKRRIPTVFTTHDYYPICLRTNLVNDAGEVCPGPQALRCMTCNYKKGLSTSQMQVMQTGLYAAIKRTKLFPLLKRIAKSFLSRKKAETPASDATIEGLYSELLARNAAIVEGFTLLLANSRLTSARYQERFPHAKIRHVPITHAGLTHAPALPKRVGGPLLIGYAGGNKEYKGFGVLMDSLPLLDECGIDWELYLYGDGYVECGDPRVKSCGTFAPGEADEVYRSVDVVVVPSLCPETFSFVVLEALCAGAHVVVSSSVGAAELVPNECVFRRGDSHDLAAKLKWVSENLESQAGLPASDLYSMDCHAKRVEEVYAELLDKD